jgi:hypothetical protein
VGPFKFVQRRGAGSRGGRRPGIALPRFGNVTSERRVHE